MTNTDPLDDSSLVELNAVENTFEVPAVETTTVRSNDTSTVGTGYSVQPKEVFDRDTLLAEYAISTGDTPFINLLGNFDPFYEYLTNPLIQSYIEPFYQVNFGLILTVRLVVPGSCYGVYNLQALCDGGRTVDDPPEQDGAAMDAYPNSVQDVHTFMNVDLKNDVVLELPWEHFLDAYKISDLSVGPTAGPGCWRLLLWALSPIQNTINNTATAGRVQIYARMSPDRHFENLVYQSKKKKGIHDLYPASKDMAVENHTISGTTGAMAKGAAMLGGMFPAIAPFAEGAALGLAAVSTVADMFGFTRASAPVAPTPVLRRLVNNLAPVDSEDTGEIVALSVANGTSIDPALGGGTEIDPTSFPSLFDRWTIVDTFSISELSTGVVRTLPVTPYIYNTVLGVRYVTTGGFVGLPFSSWRGGMEYMIYIPSSSNIQGSLQVLWDPRQEGPFVYAADPTNRLTNVIIDMKGTSRTLLSVDYSQPTPCLTSNFVPPDIPVTRPNTVNGQLVFKINAPLTAPRVTGFTVQVIIMARPAQDMSFGVPASHYGMETASFYIERAVEDVVYQSGDGKEATTSEQVIKLVVAKPYPVEEVLWGENFRSVRALMQKMSPIATLDFPWVASHFYNGFPHFIPPPTNSPFTTRWAKAVTPGSPPFTYFGYYSAPFVGMRGSMRYKVLATSFQQITGFPETGVDPITWPMNRGFPGTFLYDQQMIGNGFAAEFQFPYYSIRKYHPCRWHPDPFVEENIRYDYFATTDENNPVGAYATAGAGPDFTVTRFRRIPGLIF